MTPPAEVRSPGATTGSPPTLLQLAQTALRVELYTISLYLFAYYSLKEQGGKAGQQIHEIFKDEMHHVAYAGNIICYLGGKPEVYKATPILPAKMFKEELLLSQKSFANNLETFIRVEHPEPPAPPGKAVTILEHDLSIGDFYKKLETGIGGMPESEGHPESGPRQFGFSGVKKVTSQPTADYAINLIITQGEGSTPDDERSHYNIFIKLRKDTSLESLPVWENPVSANCPNPDIKKVMILYDAAYGYLLLLLEKLWTVENADYRNQLHGSGTGPAMTEILRPLANFLVTKELTIEGVVVRAAPACNFYEFECAAEPRPSNPKTPLAELKGLAETAVAAFSELAPVQESIGALADTGQWPFW